MVSFVNPKRVPQMAGAEEIMAALPHEDGRSRIGLVLNVRGWDRAVEASCDEVNVAVSATDGFGLRNQGMAIADQMQMLADIAERAHNMAGAGQGGPSLSATLSVVWGCPFDGEVSEDQVAAMVRDIAALGYKEIGLADTIGVGDPWTVRKRIEAARKAAPDATLRLHFHDTRNTGLANAYAGVEAGVERAGRQLRRPRRLPLRPERHRQHRHRGPGLHAGAGRLRDRLRPRRADRHRAMDRRRGGPSADLGRGPGRRIPQAATGGRDMTVHAATRAATSANWDAIDRDKYRDEAEAVAELLSRVPLNSAERVEVRDEAEAAGARRPPLGRQAGRGRELPAGVLASAPARAWR